MSIPRRAPQATTKTAKRVSASIIVVWAFVIIEAIGIGCVLIAFSSRVPQP